MAKKTTQDTVTTAAPAGTAAAVAERPSSHGNAAPELRAQLDALQAENARLRAGIAEPEQEIQRFPSVMYRKHKVDEKHANGYARRRVQETDEKGNLDTEKCEAMVAQLEKAGWLHAPKPEWAPSVAGGD